MILHIKAFESSNSLINNQNSLWFSSLKSTQSTYELRIYAGEYNNGNSRRDLWLLIMEICANDVCWFSVRNKAKLKALKLGKTYKCKSFKDNREF